MVVIYLAGNGWQYRIFIVSYNTVLHNTVLHNTVLHSIVRNKLRIVKGRITTPQRMTKPKLITQPNAPLDNLLAIESLAINDGCADK